MNWDDPWSPSSGTNWTDRIQGLIGLEELGMEPCDGTGEDAVSMRVRNKWHRRMLAERRAAEHAEFGEWLYNLRGNNSEARRLFAMWQQREELARRHALPKETLVDVLNFFTRVELDKWNIVSRKFHAGVLCAEPLRPMHSASLIYYRERDWPEKRYRAALHVVNVVQPTKCFIDLDVVNLFASFFGCLRFCYVESGISLQNIPLGRAFADGLKAISKDFRTPEWPSFDMYDVSFVEGVDPYDVITSFPSFRHITVQTLGSLVKHVGGADDALLSSLAAHGVWSVWIPGDKTKVIGWSEVVPTADVYRITEDGVLDYAFGDYDDDEEGHCLKISAEACHDRKSTHKTEVLITTRRDFDIARWNPKEIRRLNEYWHEQYAHRPVWEFHFDELAVRYVQADPQACYMPAGVIHFWRNGAPTLHDHLLNIGPR